MRAGLLQHGVHDLLRVHLRGVPVARVHGPAHRAQAAAAQAWNTAFDQFP